MYKKTKKKTKANTERRFNERCDKIEQVIKQTLTECNKNEERICTVKYNKKPFQINDKIKKLMKSEILKSIDSWKGQRKKFNDDQQCFKKSNLFLFFSFFIY